MITRQEFEALDTLDRIKSIDEAYGDKALMLASMQITSGVLMEMVHRTGAKPTILFIDTQYHFKETLELRDRFIEKYGLEIETVVPELTPQAQHDKYGRDLYLYVDGQPECCEFRKEKPFLKAARDAGIQAQFNGLMRAEGGRRSDLASIEHDARIDTPIFHPIIDWDYERLEAYSKDNDIPLHPLYAQRYLSIGCAPCTTPVKPGEDRRAGRWRHLRTEDGVQPQYCNINFTDMGGGI